MNHVRSYVLLALYFTAQSMYVEQDYSNQSIAAPIHHLQIGVSCFHSGCIIYLQKPIPKGNDTMKSIHDNWHTIIKVFFSIKTMTSLF